MGRTDAEGIRTLVIGVDGASLEVLAARGEKVIPRITELFEEGVSGALESQLPPWTPSAWPSMYTGVNPGKHGVYGFLRFDGYDWDIVNYSDVKEHTLWELLSEYGMTSVVVNAPVTHPPKSFNGALVPGYIAPENPTCHPKGLLSDLRAELGEYRVYTDGPGDGATDREWIADYTELIEMRGEAFRYLVDRFDPAFGFLQFQQTDTVFHEHPTNDTIVDGVFAAVDREIAATIDACDPDVVFLVSDHGLGEYDGDEFRVNSFLRDRGDVVTTAGEGGMPSWASISRNQLQNDSGGDDRSPTSLERALSVAAKAGLTSQRMARIVRRLGLEDVVLRVVPTDAIRAATERVDFERSRAYMRDRIELGIRINLDGREPNGLVSESEYASLRAELIDAFTAIRTPDGTPVFESVFRREEVFSGPYLDDAPDIILVPNEFDQFVSATVRPSQFGAPPEPWNHKRFGFIAATGDVDTSCDLTGAHLLDVAPTVLATLDIPASDRMDGLLLPLVDEVGVEEYPPYRGEDVDTDDSAVEDRLADLGYLER